MKSPWTLLWHPKNWLFGIALILMHLIVLLPYRSQMSLGKKLGQLLFFIDPRGKHTANINLKLCFPTLSESEHLTLLKQNYCDVGMGVIEAMLTYFGHRKKIPELTIHGLEHIQKCQANKQAILLFSAHFTCLEMIGRLVSEHMPLNVVYNPQKIKFVNHLIEYYRKKIYAGLIPRNNLRQLVRCLKKSGIVWYTPDVDAGMKNSIFAPFFGIPAATVTAASRLAKLTDGACITCFFYRKKDLSGYDVFFSPPIEQFPSDDEYLDAAKINQLIEQAIKKAPEQYLWQYKRFKTRPNDEPTLYPPQSKEK